MQHSTALLDNWVDTNPIGELSDIELDVVRWKSIQMSLMVFVS
jgi:hypothetical protein